MSSLLRTLFNTSGRHKKLSEEMGAGDSGNVLVEEPSPEEDVLFYCKYLGSSLVADPKGEAGTAEAIAHIIIKAKQTGNKPDRVALHVSLKGIRVEDTLTGHVLLKTSIYKISYCSADAHYDHVFAFIATNEDEVLECHAFLCPKRKMAQSVTISIAQTFNLAYECWKMKSDDSGNLGKSLTTDMPNKMTELSSGTSTKFKESSQYNSQVESDCSSPVLMRSDFGSSDLSSGYHSSNPMLLLDLEERTDLDNQPQNGSSSTSVLTQKTSKLNKLWAEFEDSTYDDLSRLKLDDKSVSLQSTLSSPLSQCIDKQTGKNYLPINHSTPFGKPLQVNRSLSDPWAGSQASPPLPSYIPTPSTNGWESFNTNPNPNPNPNPNFTSLETCHQSIESNLYHPNSESFDCSNTAYLKECQSPTFVSTTSDNFNFSSSQRESSPFPDPRESVDNKQEIQTSLLNDAFNPFSSNNSLNIVGNEPSKTVPSVSNWQSFPEDAAAAAISNPIDNFTSNLKPNNISITSCGNSQSLWGNGIDNKSGNILCS